MYFDNFQTQKKSKVKRLSLGERDAEDLPEIVKTKQPKNLHVSPYLESYAYFWIFRREFNYFIKNVAENNNIQGKKLLQVLESESNLIKTLLRNLQSDLSRDLLHTQSHMILQRWRLQCLQELCIGPCPENQSYMVQRDFNWIFDLKFVRRLVPLDITHIKYQRDLSLVKYFLSVIEGAEDEIVEKIRLTIKPQTILEHIKILLSVLALDWYIGKYGDRFHVKINVQTALNDSNGIKRKRSRVQTPESKAQLARK